MTVQSHNEERHPLELLPDDFAIIRLAADAPLPSFVLETPIWSVTRTDHELSILCNTDSIPTNFKTDKDSRVDGYRALRICGELDFSLIGILAGLLNVIASVKVSVLTLSTFDTDYVFVRDTDLETAIGALVKDGYTVNRD